MFLIFKNDTIVIFVKKIKKYHFICRPDIISIKNALRIEEEEEKLTTVLRLAEESLGVTQSLTVRGRLSKLFGITLKDKK